MKFHAPSFLLGFGTAAVLIGSREALRPAFVELAALALHIGRIGRAVVVRQRENLEDLFAEIDMSAKRRARRDNKKEAYRPAAQTH